MSQRKLDDSSLMNKRNELIGRKYGRLTVVQCVSVNSRRQRIWLCECICGNKKEIVEYSLLIGDTKSCGCLHRESITKHGHTSSYSTSAEYAVWSAMMQRCFNVNCKNYRRYGGRGISVDAKWMKFDGFIEDMGRRPTPKHSLDRIDNNGNYEANNCRWATRKTQDRNTSRVHWVEFKGRTVSLMEACEESGVGYSAARSRIRSGWDIVDVFNKPVSKRIEP